MLSISDIYAEMWKGNKISESFNYNVHKVRKIFGMIILNKFVSTIIGKMVHLWKQVMIWMKKQ